MRNLKILHAADLHLDSPFEGLPGGKAAVRRAEQRELLNALADLSLREHVDLVLLSGDLLDSSKAYYETGDELTRALNNIPAPVFIAPGNHDYYTPKCPYARLKLPENVYIFNSSQMDRVELPGMSAVIYGAAFTDSHSGPMLEGFRAEKKDGYYNIMCIHGEVGNPDSVYNPISEKQLEESGTDYVALGHIHKASGLKKAGSTYYSWPGCPEGRGFDETGDKFVNIVEFEDDKCTLTPVSIASRRYELLNVDVTDSDPLIAISSQLPDDTVRDIYRIVLKGHAEQRPDIKDLYEKLSHMFFELQLRDETKPMRSVWEKEGEDSLRGIFLKKLHDRYRKAGSEAERAEVEQAARWGLAALDNGEELVIHEDR